MIKVIGLGAGGHTRVIIEILQRSGDYELVGLLDPRQELWNSTMGGVKVLGGDDMLPGLYQQGVHHAFVGVGGVGDTRPRKKLYQNLIDIGFEPVAVIHPQAVIAPSVEMGWGPNIMANAVVNTAARLGDNVIINTGAIVEHDCIISDHVHVATGACLASNVNVGEGAHIGLGASVRQGINIGKNSIIAAGAVVVDDVSDNVTVAGVPAQIIKGR